MARLLAAMAHRIDGPRARMSSKAPRARMSPKAPRARFHPRNVLTYTSDDRAARRRLTMIGTELITVSSALSRRAGAVSPSPLPLRPSSPSRHPIPRKLPRGLRAEVYFIMTRINHN